MCDPVSRLGIPCHGWIFMKFGDTRWTPKLKTNNSVNIVRSFYVTGDCFKNLWSDCQMGNQIWQQHQVENMNGKAGGSVAGREDEKVEGGEK